MVTERGVIARIVVIVVSIVRVGVRVVRTIVGIIRVIGIVVVVVWSVVVKRRFAKLTVNVEINTETILESLAETVPNLATVRTNRVRIFHQGDNEIIASASVWDVRREVEFFWGNVVKIPEGAISFPEVDSHSTACTKFRFLSHNQVSSLNETIAGANPVFIFFLINVSPDVGLAVPANRPGIAKGTIFFAIGVVIGIVTVAVTSLLEVAGIAAVLAIVMVASWCVQVAVAGVERVVRAEANERCWVAVVGVVLLNESRVVAGLKGTKFRIAANRPVVDSKKVFLENGTDAHLVRNWIHETI